MLTGYGEELLILVELYAGHDGAVVEHVGGVGEGGERPDGVVPRETGQAAPELLQALRVLLRPPRLRLLHLGGEEELLDPGVGVAGHEVAPVVVHPLSPAWQGALLPAEDGLVCQEVEPARVPVELVPLDAGHHAAVAGVLPVQAEAVGAGQDGGGFLQLSEDLVHMVQVSLGGEGGGEDNQIVIKIF